MGQTALVTGGGSGLGRAIALGLAQAGARVVVVGRREAELVETLASLKRDCGYRVQDFTRFEELSSLAESVTRDFGPVDCLVNNADIHFKMPALETTVEEFSQVLTTHVLGGPCAHPCLCSGTGAGGPGIDPFHSVNGLALRPSAGGGLQRGKGRLPGLVRSPATELSPQGVRVKALAPGWIETEMSRKALRGTLSDASAAWHVLRCRNLENLRIVPGPLSTWPHPPPVFSPASCCL